MFSHLNCFRIWSHASLLKSDRCTNKTSKIIVHVCYMNFNLELELELDFDASGYHHVPLTVNIKIILLFHHSIEILTTIQIKYHDAIWILSIVGNTAMRQFDCYFNFCTWNQITYVDRQVINWTGSNPMSDHLPWLKSRFIFQEKLWFNIQIKDSKSNWNKKFKWEKSFIFF